MKVITNDSNEDDNQFLTPVELEAIGHCAIPILKGHYSIEGGRWWLRGGSAIQTPVDRPGAARSLPTSTERHPDAGGQTPGGDADRLPRRPVMSTEATRSSLQSMTCNP